MDETTKRLKLFCIVTLSPLNAKEYDKLKKAVLREIDRINASIVRTPALNKEH